jgi:CTP:molybdopterin cytidylyltransferase MocA
MAVATDLGLVRLEEDAWRAVDPDGLSFMDVDTPEDFAAAVARLESRGA